MFYYRIQELKNPTKLNLLIWIHMIHMNSYDPYYRKLLLFTLSIYFRCCVFSSLIQCESPYNDFVVKTEFNLFYSSMLGHEIYCARCLTTADPLVLSLALKVKLGHAHSNIRLCKNCADFIESKFIEITHSNARPLYNFDRYSHLKSFRKPSWF